MCTMFLMKFHSIGVPCSFLLAVPQKLELAYAVPVRPDAQSPCFTRSGGARSTVYPEDVFQEGYDSQEFMKVYSEPRYDPVDTECRSISAGLPERSKYFGAEFIRRTL